MKQYFLFFIVFIFNCTAHSQIGIGTTTPNVNAALDITSTNKGLMLPRLADTGLVSNPVAGLFIYNRNSNSPAYHNGTNWVNLNSTTVLEDSITYTITGGTPSNGFTNGTFPLLSVDNGITDDPASIPSFQNINFSKKPDINSIAFIRAMALGSQAAYTAIVIEFKFYNAGASTPYYSIKASLPRSFSYYNVSNAVGSSFSEQLRILPGIFGYKDWVNNLSFAWNVNTQQLATY